MHPSQPEVPAPPPGPPPSFSYAVLGGSVAVFVAGALWPSLGDALVLYGPLVRDGEWWRVLGATVLHANALHLFFNMSAVWTVGRAYERDIGTARFVEVSLVSALGSSAFVLWLGFELPTVGASGMILGWFGAVLPIATGSHRRQVLVWLAQVAILSALPGVSWQAHLGGFVAGLCCGAVLRFLPRSFRYAAPVLAFVFAVLTVLAARR